MFPTRRACFGTIRGSNVEFRSRGILMSNGPFVVATVFDVFPFRELPVPPAGRVSHLVTQMLRHFRFECSFEDRFRDLVQKSVDAVKRRPGRLCILD